MYKWLTVIAFALVLTACGDSSSSDSNSASSNSTGTGGSTARFTTQSGFLIVVEDTNINSYDLSEPLVPNFVDDLFSPVGGLETVFPFGESLIFIGSEVGAAIVRVHDGIDIGETGYGAGELEIIAQISHTRACDPVVANETHMYVTIRDGTGCGTALASNRLFVYDITDIESPEQIATESLYRPFGLSLRDKELFVCYEGGLVHFDITDPETPHVLGDYSELECNDVIALETHLVLTSDEGVQQAVLQDGLYEVVSSITKGS